MYRSCLTFTTVDCGEYNIRVVVVDVRRQRACLVAIVVLVVSVLFISCSPYGVTPLVAAFFFGFQSCFAS